LSVARPSKHIHFEVQGSVFAIVATREALLARTWIAQLGDAGIDLEKLGEAGRLVDAVAQQRIEPYCEEVVLDERYRTERDYLCGKFGAIVKALHIRPASLSMHPHAAFYYADALYRQKKLQSAFELFAGIESDVHFRINNPAASILSMDRLGRILLARGNDVEAKRWLERFLSTWEGLELPLGDYMEAVALVRK
jgi:hypothetical protein